MTLPEYLTEIEHAVRTVISEIHVEHVHLARLQRELVALTAATDDGYQRVNFLVLNPELDYEGLGTAIHWETYFGPDKERFNKNADVQATKAKIETRSFSVAALSGNLLQYAKQGLSLRYGKNRVGCPIGRNIHGIPVHEIIWQGRNQAMHWEEEPPHKPVVNCFESLATNVSAVFSEFNQRNMAFEVIDLLGWSSVEAFNRDMQLYT